MSETLKAISLFSGAGGMDVGVLQAGFDIKACVEIDKNCCATLRENIKRKKEIPLYMRVIYESLAPVQSLKRLNCRRVKSIYCLAAPPAKRSLK